MLFIAFFPLHFYSYVYGIDVVGEYFFWPFSLSLSLSLSLSGSATDSPETGRERDTPTHRHTRHISITQGVSEYRSRYSSIFLYHTYIAKFTGTKRHGKISHYF